MDFQFGMEENQMEEMQREDLFRDIAKCVRSVEFFAVIFFLGWLLIHLTFAIDIFGMFARGLVSILLTPFCLFVLFNIILVALFKTCRFSAETVAKDNADTNLYEEVVVQPIYYFGQEAWEGVEVVDEEKQQREAFHEEVEYVDKVIIFETCSCSQTWETDDEEEMDMGDTSSESEEVVWENEEEEELQPSEPEIISSMDKRYEMSIEEFNKTVEAFIRKQWMFFYHQEFIARAIETYYYVRG